ncbi:MAG TPA: hypothetical protein VEA80_09200 [Vitreimonas sp.]|uniref:hypothetical protein n=1 Tax=Vitreimonas sp. TaxID=3069702 RepID=UPI002D70852C|nr:hypothetical protein [Vitreimonas sp.]HYD87638.1 hypothetical protein [Vitreimonas sp.]
MDCAQALAVAAAALVLAGEPLMEPVWRAHEALVVAVDEGEALVKDAACAAEATWAGMFDERHPTELALHLDEARSGGAPNIPDARIHVAFRRPI